MSPVWLVTLPEIENMPVFLLVQGPSTLAGYIADRTLKLVSRDLGV